MDEKRLEQEYRELKHKAAPDLWDRIEKGLKEHPRRQETETISDTEPVVWDEKSARLMEIPDREGKRPQKRLRRIYGMAAAAAAMLALVITVPKMTDKKSEMKSMARDAGQEIIAAETKADIGNALSEAGGEDRAGDRAEYKAEDRTEYKAEAGTEDRAGYKAEARAEDRAEYQAKAGTTDGILYYEELKLAAYRPMAVPENAVTVPEDSQYFSEAILKDAQLLCGGTVTKVSFEKDSSGKAVKVVYEMTLDQVYYAEDYTAGMETITVKSPIIKTDGDEVYILYQLQPGGVYLLPLCRKDKDWELLYPFAPQIQVTGDGEYLFHSGYASLVNEATSVVIGSQEGSNDYYYDRMVLRKDEDFLSDLLALAGH